MKWSTPISEEQHEKDRDTRRDLFNQKILTFTKKPEKQSVFKKVWNKITGK